MYKLQRKLFSQNFLHSRKLVHELIRGSSIGKHDLVLEIGPGKGILTEELLKQSQHVIAVEIDSQWYKYLQEKLSSSDNLTLYHEDFLNFKLPSLPYKVFANIPFSIEGKIIRRLIDAKNPPEDCYLVMMKDVAYRLSAPYKDNQFSIMHKPWFEFSIYYHFSRKDFTPYSNVESVMIRFMKRENPLLSWDQKEKYQRFIEEDFQYGLPVFQHLKRRYGKGKAVEILGQIQANKQSKPSYINMKEWIRLYKLLNG